MFLEATFQIYWKKDNLVAIPKTESEFRPTFLFYVHLRLDTLSIVSYIVNLNSYPHFVPIDFHKSCDSVNNVILSGLTNSLLHANKSAKHFLCDFMECVINGRTATVLKKISA